MQCLYCSKKLGLFASKRRPFCSEQHEVAYNDEQAGLAMRKVTDPLFLASLSNVMAQVQAQPVTAPPPVVPPPPIAEAVKSVALGPSLTEDPQSLRSRGSMEGAEPLGFRPQGLLLPVANPLEHQSLGLTVTGSLAPLKIAGPAAQGWKTPGRLRESPPRLRHPDAKTEPVLRPGSASPQTSGWSLAALAEVPPAYEVQVFEASVFDVKMPACPLFRAVGLCAASRQGTSWRGQELVHDLLKVEEIRNTQRVRVSNSCQPEPRGLAIARASLMGLARGTQSSTQSSGQPGQQEGQWPDLAMDSIRIRRARLASILHIREPEPAKSHPRDLPSVRARLEWKGIGQNGDKQAPVFALPLRPALQNPGWGDGPKAHSAGC